MTATIAGWNHITEILSNVALKYQDSQLKHPVEKKNPDASITMLILWTANYVDTERNI
jgi:hypothetical protein